MCNETLPCPPYMTCFQSTCICPTQYALQGPVCATQTPAALAQRICCGIWFAMAILQSLRCFAHVLYAAFQDKPKNPRFQHLRSPNTLSLMTTFVSSIMLAASSLSDLTSSIWHDDDSNTSLDLQITLLLIGTIFLFLSLVVLTSSWYDAAKGNLRGVRANRRVMLIGFCIYTLLIVALISTKLFAVAFIVYIITDALGCVALVVSRRLFMSALKESVFRLSSQQQISNRVQTSAHRYVTLVLRTSTIAMFGLFTFEIGALLIVITHPLLPFQFVPTGSTNGPWLRPVEWAFNLMFLGWLLTNFSVLALVIFKNTVSGNCFSWLWRTPRSSSKPTSHVSSKSKLEWAIPRDESNEHRSGDNLAMTPRLNMDNGDDGGAAGGAEKNGVVHWIRKSQG